MSERPKSFSQPEWHCGSERELAARARIMEARGDIEDAIRALRDEKDADCRSIILSVIAKHKGDDDALDWFRDQSLSPADLTPNGVMALCSPRSNKCSPA